MTGRAVAVRHVPFEDLGLLEPLLLARGYAVEYLEAGVDPISPQLLSSPDVVVVLGGPIGVGDTAAYSPLTLTATGRGSPLSPVDGAPVLHWHGDQFAIPPGAATLAETPGFPHQAFAPGPGSLALQFHLEADHTRLEPWLIGHTVELTAADVDDHRLRADVATYGPALAQAAEQVFTAWLDEVESVLRASKDSGDILSRQRTVRDGFGQIA